MTRPLHTRLRLGLLLITAVCSFHAQADIKNVQTTQMLIALTFDDGPVPGDTEEILDILKREGAKCTFFVEGRRVADHPDIARRIIAEGHELANHSYTHPHLSKLPSIEAIREEIHQTQAAIEEQAKVSPSLFRAPFFDIDERVTSVIGELGLPHVRASILTEDWRKEITREDVTKAVLENPQPGDIALMHDWSASTIQALPGVLSQLKKRGFTMVTVSDLIATEGE